MNRFYVKSVVITILLFLITACAMLPGKQQQSVDIASAQVQAAIEWPPLVDETELLPMPVNIEELWAVKEKTVVPKTGELHDRFRPLGTSAEVKCMAQAIYYESKSEPEIGKIGVGYAVLNRTGHKYYPGTVCGVVYGKTPRGRCEFDWACGGNREMPNQKQRAEAERVAKLVIAKQVPNPVGNSVFFRALSQGHASYGIYYRTIHGHRFFTARV